MNPLTKELEYYIDNNFFFEELKYHTCNLHVVQFIKYFQMKNIITPNQLVDNTINRYLDMLEENRRLYELEKDFNLLHSKKRYKNYITKEKLEKIKYKFINSKLYYLDWVIDCYQNPILEYLYLFINSINNSLYIKETQFNNSTQYNYDNFENKLKKIKVEAENNNDENRLIDAKIHEGLIKTYKDDKIEGSAIISSITNKFVYEFLKNIDLDEFEDINDKDIEILKRNQFFHKRFERVNFTEKEMLDGFAQACYYNYAQARFEEFKILMKNFNLKKNKTTTIPKLTKDFIERAIVDLFNSILEKEQIISIYKTKKPPNILKNYENITIYTTKNLDKLDKDFYKFILENFFDETEKIKKFKKEHEKELKNLIFSLRILFY